MNRKYILRIIVCCLIINFIVLASILVKHVAQNRMKQKSGQVQAATSCTLQEALEQGRWAGKTRLVWINGDPCEDSLLIALNDALVEAGRDYIITYQQEDMYASDYQNRLTQMKQQGTCVDLLNVGGTVGAKAGNRYREAIEKGLLEPLDEFLKTDIDGQKLYAVYDSKQWDSVTIDGHIYSYDWRGQPVSDLCAYVATEYVDKYRINEDNQSLQELFQMAEQEANKRKKEQATGIFYPVIWSDRKEPDNYWKQSDIMETLRKYSELVTYQEDAFWNPNMDFFMCVREEVFSDTSDSCILLEDNERTSRETKKILLKKDSFQPVTSNLTGVASWSAHKKEAMDFLMLVNTDKEIANLLQYGIEGIQYTVEEGRIIPDYEKSAAFGSFGIQNKWITSPYGLEPVDKVNSYRSYIKKHLQ